MCALGHFAGLVYEFGVRVRSGVPIIPSPPPPPPRWQHIIHYTTGEGVALLMDILTGIWTAAVSP